MQVSKLEPTVLAYYDWNNLLHLVCEKLGKKSLDDYGWDGIVTEEIDEEYEIQDFGEILNQYCETWDDGNPCFIDFTELMVDAEPWVIEICNAFIEITGRTEFVIIVDYR